MFDVKSKIFEEKMKLEVADFILNSWFNTYYHDEEVRDGVWEKVMDGFISDERKDELTFQERLIEKAIDTVLK